MVTGFVTGDEAAAAGALRLGAPINFPNHGHLPFLPSTRPHSYNFAGRTSPNECHACMRFPASSSGTRRRKKMMCFFRRRRDLAGHRRPQLAQHCLRRLLLLLLLLAVVADRPFAAASFFFGGNTDTDCSRTCESEHCTAAPLMRYGKYCGVSYTGCPGEAPCDALDACCLLHDACVQATDNDYLNTWCNQSLLDCVSAARSSTATAVTFAGNSCNVTEVADEITSAVEAAVFIKRIFHRP